MSTALFVLGAAAFVAGLALIYLPLAFIGGGLFAVVLAVGIDGGDA